jgi:hypothetical protein
MHKVKSARPSEKKSSFFLFKPSIERRRIDRSNSEEEKKKRTGKNCHPEKVVGLALN